MCTVADLVDELLGLSDEQLGARYTIVGEGARARLRALHWVLHADEVALVPDGEEAPLAPAAPVAAGTLVVYIEGTPLSF